MFRATFHSIELVVSGVRFTTVPFKIFEQKNVSDNFLHCVCKINLQVSFSTTIENNQF